MDSPVDDKMRVIEGQALLRTNIRQLGEPDYQARAQSDRIER